VKAKM